MFFSIFHFANHFRDAKEGDEILVRYAHRSKTPNGSWQPDVWLPRDAQFVTLAMASATRSVIVDELLKSIFIQLTQSAHPSWSHNFTLICRQLDTSVNAVGSEHEDAGGESESESDDNSDSEFDGDHASEINDSKSEPECFQSKPAPAPAQSQYVVIQVISATFFVTF